MKASSARPTSISPHSASSFSFHKFSTPRLLSTSNSRTLFPAQSALSLSRESPYVLNSPSRSRSQLTLLLPLSGSVVSPSRTRAGGDTGGSVLKKYAKELFKRYDERTAELNKAMREKQELEKQMGELAQRVAALEREKKRKAEQVLRLQQSQKHHSSLPQAMEDFRRKVKKLLQSKGVPVPA